MGLEKFAAQVWKVGTCHEICEKKRHHKGISLRSCPKNIGATACRAWARAETFNGQQKVLENVYIPDSKT